MLILSRKIGETLKIGDAITVHVLRVGGNRVTLAVDAPLDVRILRGELASRFAEHLVQPPLDAEALDNLAAQDAHEGT